MPDAARQIDLADRPSREQRHGFQDLRAAAALGAVLHDAAVFPGGLDDLAAFPESQGQRLLDVGVLAGLHRPDGAEGVPVGGRGVNDGVDRLVFDHPPHVADGRHPFAAVEFFAVRRALSTGPRNRRRKARRPPRCLLAISSRLRIKAKPRPFTPAMPTRMRSFAAMPPGRKAGARNSAPPA